jgi:hypothetical protein
MGIRTACLAVLLFFALILSTEKEASANLCSPKWWVQLGQTLLGIGSADSPALKETSPDATVVHSEYQQTGLGSVQEFRWFSDGTVQARQVAMGAKHEPVDAWKQHVPMDTSENRRERRKVEQGLSSLPPEGTFLIHRETRDTSYLNSTEFQWLSDGTVRKRRVDFGPSKEPLGEWEKESLPLPASVPKVLRQEFRDAGPGSSKQIQWRSDGTVRERAVDFGPSKKPLGDWRPAPMQEPPDMATMRKDLKRRAEALPPQGLVIAKSEFRDTGPGSSRETQWLSDGTVRERPVDFGPSKEPLGPWTIRK